MTKAELKLRENNLKESLSGLSKLSTDFDSLMKQVTDAQAEGTSGDLEAKLNQRIADLANITKGSEFYIDPQTGRGFIVKKDTEGNIIEKIDANRVNNPGMTKAPKADVGDFISGVVGDWQETTVTDRFGNMSQSLSQGREDQFNLGIKSLAASALKDSRFAYSVLADNGAGEETDYGYFQDYQAYFNEEDKNRIIQSRLEDAIIAKGMTTTIIKDDGSIEEIPGSEFTDEEKEQFIKDQENFLVELREDENGNPQPVINEELKQKVVQFIRDQADLQIGSKERAAKQIKTKEKEPEPDVSYKWKKLDNYENIQSAIAKNNTALINKYLKKIPYDKKFFYEWDSKNRNFKIYDRDKGATFRGYKKYKDDPEKYKEQGKGLTTQRYTLEDLLPIIFGRDFDSEMARQRALRNEKSGGGSMAGYN